MVRNPGKLFLALCLLTIGGGVVVNAQVASIPQLEATVPFDFVVGNTKLPAGKYEIRTVDDNEPNVLEIRSANGHTTVMFDTENAQNRGDQIENKSELVFSTVGDQHFLFQIWVAGSSSGNELPKSKKEKKLTDGGSQSQRQSVAAVMKRPKP